MRILITGRGSAGTWQIRGVQLGQALGATIKPLASISDMRAHDAIVVVKRIPASMAPDLASCGRPVIWDCLDWYSQPNHYDRTALIELTKAYARSMGATAIVAATQRMAEDLGTEHWLPHHGMDRGVTEIRQDVRSVAYEGSERYIKDLIPHIEEDCHKRGWTFTVNPADYVAADIVIALRAPEWTCYASKHWKSGVKLSNAQITGKPFIGCREAGYLEQASGAECWADSRKEFRDALDRLADPAVRREASRQMLARAPRLESVATQYARLLRSLS